MLPETLSVLSQVNATGLREPLTLPEPVPAVWQAARENAAAHASAPRIEFFMPPAWLGQARWNAGQTTIVVSAYSPVARPTRVKRVRLWISSGLPGSATSKVSTNSSLE